jgi:hypothetical protein
MQTFLTDASTDALTLFNRTARELDWQRLGKQRVEALQILNTLQGKSNGWANHPAVRMWRGYEFELECYMDAMIREWQRRGYKNNMLLRRGIWVTGVRKPEWLTEELARSHRSNLLRKLPTFYRALWPNEPDDLAYVWPV